MSFRFLLVPVLVSFWAGAADNEGSIFPKLSPPASVSQVIGTTTVGVEYHRPQVKGRRIWGDLVPFGQVWRSGANDATTIRFSDPVKVNGLAVPSGTYALFSIPGPEVWTIILNKRWKQFGAFEYQPKEDLLRFEVKSKTIPTHTEWLTYEINPASRSSAYVDLYWEHLRVSFLVEVDVDAMVSARMKRAMAHSDPDNWHIYCDAAQYFLEQGTDLSQALAWVDRSIRIQENPSNLFVKARLLKELGQLGQALNLIEKALRTAKAQNAQAAIAGPIQQTLDQWKRIQGMNGSHGRGY